jgi:hypothetical protein
LAFNKLVARDIAAVASKKTLRDQHPKTKKMNSAFRRYTYEEEKLDLILTECCALVPGISHVIMTYLQRILPLRLTPKMNLRVQEGHHVWAQSRQSYARFLQWQKDWKPKVPIPQDIPCTVQTCSVEELSNYCNIEERNLHFLYRLPLWGNFGGFLPDGQGIFAIVQQTLWLIWPDKHQHSFMLPAFHDVLALANPAPDVYVFLILLTTQTPFEPYFPDDQPNEPDGPRFNVDVLVWNKTKWHQSPLFHHINPQRQMSFPQANCSWSLSLCGRLVLGLKGRTLGYQLVMKQNLESQQWEIKLSNPKGLLDAPRFDDFSNVLAEGKLFYTWCSNSQVKGVTKDEGTLNVYSFDDRFRLLGTCELKHASNITFLFPWRDGFLAFSDADRGTLLQNMVYYS